LQISAIFQAIVIINRENCNIWGRYMVLHLGKLLSNIMLGCNYFLATNNPAYSSKASTRQEKV
jgi:hypothetical protein